MQEEIEEALRILEEFSESTKRNNVRRDSVGFTDEEEGKEAEPEEVTESETEGEKRRSRRRSRFSSIYSEKNEKRGSKSMVSLPVEVFSSEPERRPSSSLPSRSSIMECTATELTEHADQQMDTILENLQPSRELSFSFDVQPFKPKEGLEDLVILDLSQKRQEPEQATCNICFERIVDYQLSCLDQFCSMCLREHFMTKILEGQALHITCPGSCSSVVSDADIKANLSPQMVEKYAHFKKMAALRADPNCRWCPKPNCETAVIANLDSPDFPALECSKCATKFCYQCNQTWHPKLSCKKNAIQLKKKGIINTRDEKWKKKNAKKCPKCRVDIEKESGCNHIICTSCSHQFCWLCMGEYTPDHYATGSCANKCFEAEDEFDLFGSNFGKPRTPLQKVARVGKYSLYTVAVIVGVGVGVPLALGCLPFYGLGLLAAKAVKR
eukprot:TRINITY_DN515_c0_g1_i2.p1 TRINITY_DN515_c0_g1~~TRINITY_DN515_c0_g1_i2.p1  ORF type:complete len:440 (+),score=84.79 TRINITY_DN515_c0_g1_i2:217-1536(+)